MSDTNTVAGGRKLFRSAARAWVQGTSPPRRPTRPDVSALADVPGQTLDDVVGVGRLMACLEHNRRYGGHAPGPDGTRYRDYGRQEAARAFEVLRKRVLDRVYLPPPPRIVPIPKRDGTYRELELADLTHRALATSARLALHHPFQPFMSELCHSTGGRGVHTMLAALKAAYESGLYKVLANLDVRKAFPSLPVAPVVDLVGRVVPDPGLAWLVGVLVRGTDGNERTTGIPQGDPTSPSLLDLILSVALDSHWSNTPDGPFTLRYVDNIPILAGNVDEGRVAVERCRQLLSRMGLSLKTQTEPEYLVDLYLWQTTELLGFSVYAEYGEMKFGITDSALTSLGDKLREAHSTDHPPVTAKAVVDGWVTAAAPAFDSRRDRNLVRQILDVARSMGFEELSTLSVEQRWKAAWCSWRGTLQKYRGDLQRGATTG